MHIDLMLGGSYVWHGCLGCRENNIVATTTCKAHQQKVSSGVSCSVQDDHEKGPDLPHNVCKAEHQHLSMIQQAMCMVKMWRHLAHAVNDPYDTPFPCLMSKEALRRRQTGYCHAS